MTTKINQKEYLKKYLSGDKVKKKKKDKKHKKLKAATVKIIDDDEYGGDNLDDFDEELLLAGDDAPIIVGEYIDLNVNNLKASKWRSIAVKDEPEDDGDIKIKQEDDPWGKCAKAVIKTEPLSPPNVKSRRDKKDTPDNSPRRKKKKDRRKESPPRRRKSPSPDQSPVRRRVSPQIKKSLHSPDQSPPRRRRRDSDQSPPRRRDKSSPPRRQRGRSSDQSPPRRRGSDQSPPRRNRGHSPPRRKRESTPDQSPQRRRRRDSDQSPVRIKREKCSPDQSPPRQSIKKERLSPPAPSQRRSRWADVKERSPSPPPTHKPKDKRTLDGKKAGLQDAQSLKTETEERRRQEDRMFSKMSKDISGRDAEVQVRSTGRRGKRARDAAAEDPEERRRKEEHEATKKKLYDRWGKGLKQVADHEARVAENEYESSKPLARYSDDQDLDKHLRDQERADDPMLEYMREKKREQQKADNVPVMPVYQGNYPENRFGILPGYRWDGVDRTNGYEKRWFDVQNEKKAIREVAYKYSVEDM